MTPQENPWTFVASLAGIGALIALGRTLAEDAPVPSRVMLGRAILSAGTGVAAGSVLMFFPDAPALLLYGVGAALASLGTSGIELLLSRRFGTSRDVGVQVPPNFGTGAGNLPPPPARRPRFGDPE
jgi:hypothetical protein